MVDSNRPIQNGVEGQAGVCIDTIDDSDNEGELEYNVEAIRAKRLNRETGTAEYFIKWEGYPESQNTWEPIEHLECPDLLTKFEEEQKQRRPPRKTRQTPASDSKAAITKRPRAARLNTSLHQRAGDALLELNGDEQSNHSSATISDYDMNAEDGEIAKKDISTTSKVESPKPAPVSNIEPPPKGFDRGLEIDSILGACIDDREMLWFLIKWKNGQNDVELVDSKEVEEKAPRRLCSWYRQRLYHSIRLPSEPANIQQVASQTA